MHVLFEPIDKILIVVENDVEYFVIDVDFFE